MTQTTGGGLGALGTAMTGSVLVDGDLDYDEARSLWNGEFDRRPAVIARCATASDVALAVDFGRQEGLEITVRGGGHSFSGASACDGGLMIHLGTMNHVAVDPERRRAVVGGGATLADLDAATQAHGLAVTGGVISHTGVGGLTLGGGMGWLVQEHGLSIDNLESAEVVLADGRCVRASADEHPDLFWALRGGGGNFGVVTSFEFRLHPVGPEVHLAFLFWDQDRGVEALRACRDAIPSLPERTGLLIAAALSAPDAPFVPEEYHFMPGHALIVVGFGSAEEHAAAIAPVREVCPPLFELVTPIPYTGLQQMLDDAAPWGIRSYDKCIYLEELTDEAIDVIVGRAPDKASPMSFMPIFRLDGAFERVGEDDTAFGGRRVAQYMVDLTGVSEDEELFRTDRGWVRSTWDALRPLAGSAAGYLNLNSEPDDDRVRAAYGSAKYERLARIKAEYDPGNLFHHNANIKPT
ncbi:FAD-binding oxidoreductase [Pseudonocardia bannensis]|uniref:FAD-binding oxidoreductase n=1 Tax=Pseudonocardia bannensis TaxID=630973 RepID=A0A848DKV5_9PSEU|nr:FAD-binding oxidoreductase [Pseudonocardia bannensis]NMH93322.1 FAD-binding oxidoreductase [Pseudonocardia bannensis]